MAEKQETPEAEQPAGPSKSHDHQWRTSFNPDGSARQLCDFCGAIQDA